MGVVGKVSEGFSDSVRKTGNGSEDSLVSLTQMGKVNANVQAAEMTASAAYMEIGNEIGEIGETV